MEEVEVVTEEGEWIRCRSWGRWEGLVSQHPSHTELLLRCGFRPSYVGLFCVPTRLPSSKVEHCCFRSRRLKLFVSPDDANSGKWLFPFCDCEGRRLSLMRSRSLPDDIGRVPIGREFRSYLARRFYDAARTIRPHSTTLLAKQTFVIRRTVVPPLLLKDGFSGPAMPVPETSTD